MTKAAVEISIAIATLNARHALERNLAAIVAAPSRRSVEVIVVDDGSVDGTAAMVADKFPQVQLLVNPRNIGYAYSCNRAIAVARGRYVQVLNNDVELLEGTLDALADFLEQHPDAGVAGSLLINEDGSLQQSAKALPTVQSALFGGRSWFTRLMPNNRYSRRELQHWRAEAGVPFTVGYVSGASMMAPRDVLDAIGPLDARLFYFNDADFCKRIWDINRSVYCVPAARSIHLNHQGGSRKGLKRRLWALLIFHRGAYLYARKHSGYPVWHPYQLLVALGLGARLVGAAGLQFGRELTGMDRRLYGG